MRFLLLVLLLAARATAADTTADLIALEKKMTDALQRSDVDALAALWTDDLVWIGLSGQPSSKAQQLAGMKPKPRQRRNRRRPWSASSTRTSRCGYTASRPS